MIVYLVEALPALKTTGEVVALRWSNTSAWTRADGVQWQPRLSVPFRRGLQVFDGAFSSQPQEYGSVEVAMSTGDLVSPVIGMAWDGRRVRVWRGQVGQNTGQMTLVYDGQAETIEATRQGYKIALRGPGYALTKNLLSSLYDGSGGYQGGGDLANTPRPMLLGTALSLEPVYVNRAKGIFQYHGYGPGAIQGVYDGGAALAFNGTDYADYAALDAATVKGGEYATCNALGLGRHGGEPIATLSVDASGAIPGGAIGNILGWLAGQVNVPYDAATFVWLNQNLGHPQDNYITEQQSVEAVVRDMLLKLGGYLWFRPDGLMSAGLVRRGAAPTIALGRNQIASLDIRATQPPFFRRRMGYRRVWRVHSFGDVRTPKEVNPRGTYSATTAYGYYDLVAYGADTWLHIGTDATTGVAPVEGAVWTKFGVGVTKTSQLTDDANLGLTATWPNVADPNGSRPKDYADVTAQNVASGITGQGTGATANNLSGLNPGEGSKLGGIEAGATNDVGGDTRDSNFPPSHYYANYVRRIRTEMKNYAAIGLENPGSSVNVYASLESYASWGDPSGGPVWQRATNALGQRFLRFSTGLTTWSAWQPEYSGNRKPYFGSDLLEGAGGALATLNGFKTSLGIASGFSGQGSLASLNSLANGSSYLTGFGALSSLASLAFGGSYLLEQAGGSAATLSNFKTALGISSGFSGQGAMASLSNIFFGGSYLLESSGGAAAQLNSFKTSLGIASGIAGQGAGATANNLAGLDASASSKLGSVEVGATNDVGADTRSTDSPPTYYRANFLRRLRTEFKALGTLGVPGNGTFGTLETIAAYQDATGGPVWQRFTDAGGWRFIRFSTNETTWGAWAVEYSANRKPYFGSDLLESSGGALATLSAFKTGLGIASGFSGQGSLASLNSLAYGGAYLTGFAAMAALDRARLMSGPGGIADETNSYWVTNSLAITSLGISSGIAGQGAGATANNLAGLNSGESSRFYGMSKGATTADNLFRDPLFEETATQWYGNAQVGVAVPAGSAQKGIRFVANGGYQGGYQAGDYMPVTGPRLFISAEVRAAQANSSLAIQARWHAADGSIISYSGVGLPVAAPDTWQFRKGWVDAPAGAVRVFLYSERGDFPYDAWIAKPRASFTESGATIGGQLGTNVIREGGALVTDAAAITSLGIASGFSGQGSLASLNSLAYGTSYLTGFAYLATVDRVHLGVGSGGVTNENNTSWVTDALAITSLGVASGFAGQGALASLTYVRFGGPATGYAGVFNGAGSAYATDAGYQTSQGIASGIAGQGAGATANSLAGLDVVANNKLTGIEPGATSDYIVDTRSSNSPPSYYRVAPRNKRLITEFKAAGAIGASAAVGTYGTLESMAGWADASGGPVGQRFTDSGGQRFIRFEAANDTWGAWQPEYNGNRKPYFGADLLEGAGGALATLAAFKTGLGIASGFSGQGALASLTYIRMGGPTGGVYAGIYNEGGTAFITDAGYYTASGVAAGFAGQGSLASKNNVTFNDIVSTGVITSYNGQGGRVERDGNGERVYYNNGQIAVKIGF